MGKEGEEGKKKGEKNPFVSLFSPFLRRYTMQRNRTRMENKIK